MSVRASSTVLIACGVALTAAACSSGAAPAKRPGAARVETATARQRDVPIEIRSIGHIEAYTTVAIQPEVTATLVRVQVRDGAFVRKGQPLFLLDRRQYAAAVQEAEANHHKDLAALKQAQALLTRDEAQARYDGLSAGRQRRLNRRHLVSNDAADQTAVSDKSMRRSVEADRAAVASAQAQIAAGAAALEAARLQLADTEIRAPISGQVGDIAVDEGNVVSADTSQLTTISDIDRVYVDFPAPGRQVSRIAPLMKERPLPVRVEPQDRGSPAVAGVLASVDNIVDSSTDTIALKAVLSNATHRFWPGEFVTATLQVGTLPGATVVPATAVQIGQHGPYVFRVRRNGTVVMQSVTTGPRVNGEIVIAHGVSSGDVVVTSGQTQLDNGTHVTVRGAAAASDAGGARSMAIRRAG